MIVQTPSGQQVTVTPGRRWHSGNTYWTGNETAATLAAYGYTVLPDPPPPAPAELAAAEAARQAAKPEALRAAENAYLAFCSQIGLTGKAGAAEIGAVCEALKAAGKPVDGLEIATRALALIHEVEVCGGSYAEIPEVPHA